MGVVLRGDTLLGGSGCVAASTAVGTAAGTDASTTGSARLNPSAVAAGPALTPPGWGAMSTALVLP